MSLAGNDPSEPSRWSWPILSNAAAKSASSAHTRMAIGPLHILQIASIASWQPRPGRNPYDRGSNLASHSGSSALRTRCWWQRSMTTGMPSGRSFALFGAFGMYTRLTGTGCHEPMDWRTCSATAILASEVSATSPSIPAVERPELRCVTCRTLTRMLAWLRSISFCRFLTFGQSPSCAALKIRCRSRRTCSSCPRQSIFSHWAGASRGWSSGPFTIRPAALTPAMAAGRTQALPSQTGVEKL
jgi:hypothetical protein